MFSQTSCSFIKSICSKCIFISDIVSPHYGILFHLIDFQWQSVASLEDQTPTWLLLLDRLSPLQHQESDLISLFAFCCRYQRWKDWLITTICLILGKPVLPFIVSLCNFSLYGYVQKISWFWGFSIYSKSLRTVFYHYITINFTFALLHCYNSFHWSEITLSINHLWKAWSQPHREIFFWPILNIELEKAILDETQSYVKLGQFIILSVPISEQVPRFTCLYFFIFLKRTFNFDRTFCWQQWSAIEHLTPPESWNLFPCHLENTK